MTSGTVNLRHLHFFREVARLRSISAASQSVHLSQPALTQAMASVERYFGASLLVRSNTGVALTAAGQICAERIERAVGQLNDAVAEIARDSRGRSDRTHLLRAMQLQALAAVVEHRSFTLAARANHVSQPTIHRAARELERTLGVALFEKTSFGVVPTREADRLARRAKLAFREISQARAEVQALGGGEAGHTVIGCMPLARSHFIPSVLLEFSREFPEHALSILEGTYDHLLSALRSGEADFLVGAMRDPVPVADVVQEHLFDDPLAIIVRAGHPLAARKRVSAAVLSQYDWIAPRAGSPLRRQFDAMFTAAGLAPPRRMIECNSLVAARALLLESDRVMLLSAHQIHYERQAGMLVALPHPAGRVVRPIGLTLRGDWHPTSAQQRLLELLRQGAARVGARNRL
jgi:LysR family transcriptional regulator, regulator for genes of the gallate degradation pathway